MVHDYEDYIDDKIEKYLIYEGAKLDKAIMLVASGTKYSLKGIIKLIEKSFDLLVRKVSDELEKSAIQVGFNKIDKITDKNKRIRLLEKKAEQHKEAFIRIIYRINKELET